MSPAILELGLGPYMMFVESFKQFQPFQVCRRSDSKGDLGQICLLQQGHARSAEPDLLDSQRIDSRSNLNEHGGALSARGAARSTHVPDCHKQGRDGDQHGEVANELPECRCTA